MRRVAIWLDDMRDPSSSMQDWELLGVEGKLSPEEVAQRWVDWLTEWRSEPVEASND